MTRLVDPSGFKFHGPFNDQKLRRATFLSMLEIVPCAAIVETGTYLGATTGMFADTGLPVWSVELDPDFHAIAQCRLVDRAEVRLVHGDSREFLRGLAAKPDFPAGRAFFYLDAHWNSDLPLLGEIETIFDRWLDPLVMVDDFRVPGMAYGYDKYPEAVIELEYIQPAARGRLAAFFPSQDRHMETGACRGYVVLCRSWLEAARLLRLVPGLRAEAGGDGER